MKSERCEARVAKGADAIGQSLNERVDIAAAAMLFFDGIATGHRGAMNSGAMPRESVLKPFHSHLVLSRRPRLRPTENPRLLPIRLP